MAPRIRDRFFFELPYFLIFLAATRILADGGDDGPEGRACTYFDSKRHASNQHGLVNCSWYATKACCKRTEVTSVFSNMYPLFGASKSCTNKINYLMCYFCSPDQHIWYKKKLSVCSEFCKLVHDDCQAASYEGKKIGSVYSNGSSFCKAQNFEVVEGKSNCFNFDPKVFGSSEQVYPLSTVFVLMLVLALLIPKRS